MGKRRREKNKKIVEKNRRKKNEETTAPWADLPQEILGIIFGKLLSAVDVIRFRAVCKSWHIDIPKDYEDHHNLPWLCNLSWSEKNPDLLECEMYDPYSRQIFKTWKLVEGRRYTKSYSKTIICLASKQGWLLIARYHDNFLKCEIFMYNPYTKDCISLPFIWKYRPRFATFSGNPAVSSNDCRVFLYLKDVFTDDVSDYDDDYIAIYGLNGDKEWDIVSLRLESQGFYDDMGFYNGCFGMQYMNEQLFCFYEDGSTIRYNLEDKSRTSIEGSHQLSTNSKRLWLVQGEGDILVACELGFGRMEYCWTFYFDWSNMSWVGSDLQEGTAVFISGDITSFVRPFEDKDDVENNKACKVYFFDEYFCKKEPSGYSFAEMRRKRGKITTVFMEPPRIN